MSKRTIALTIACAMLLFLQGARSSGPSLRRDAARQELGRSVETAKYNQILNPDAGKNLTPVEGLSGKRCGQFQSKKYEDSQKRNKTRKHGYKQQTFDHNQLRMRWNSNSIGRIGYAECLSPTASEKKWKRYLSSKVATADALLTKNCRN